MKKKLLFAYDCMLTGGTSTALLSLLRALDPKKYEIDLLLYKTGGGFYDSVPEHVNILQQSNKKSIIPKKVQKALISILNGQIFRAFFYYFFKYKNNKSKSLQMALWQASDTAHATISPKLNKQYDTVIGFIESWGAHYAVSNRVKAKKRIIWIHPDIDKSYMIAEIDKKMYKRADTVVTVSNECRDNLAKHFPEYDKKIICIENILDVESITQRALEKCEIQLDKEKINLVSVCRLTFYDKGLDRMLDAMKRLNDEKLLSGIVWYLIGSGDGRKVMEDFITENGLENFVKFLGRQLNPFPYEKDMDMFLLPSRYEGKPMAVTEAQILGLPCAVTAYAAAKEQVNDGIDGIIMENSTQGIYEFLKKLCAGEYDIELFKENIKKRDFSNKETLRKVEELF